MAIFPHAFQKLMFATAGFSKAAGTKTKAVLPAKVAIVDNATNTSLDLTAAVPTLQNVPLIRLVQGSLHANDKIAPFLGGLKQSVQSKGINAHYVSRFYRHDGHAAQANIVKVKPCADTLMLACGTTYNLRLDIKGSPTLRFLTHNLFYTFDGYTGCCNAESAEVKPWTVFEQWGLGIARHVHFQPFVSVTLKYTWTTSGAVTTSTDVVLTGSAIDTLALLEAARPAGFTTATNTKAIVEIYLTGAYAETKFGTCSFDPRDHFELEPVTILPSVVDDFGNPCASVGICTTEVQEGLQATGSGEKLVRDKILNDMYLGEDYHAGDSRLREVLDENTVFTYVDRTKLDYVTYGLLHSVPRKGNPSAAKDADHYLITILVSAADAQFETWMAAYLAQANRGVKLETF